MSSADISLPEDFADLESLAAEWALPTEAERYDRREASTFEELLHFYNAVLPRAEAAVAYLDQFPLDAFTPEQTRLMRLMFSLATVSLAVEIWKQPKTPDTGSAKLVSHSEPLPI